jgi:hypothetical protein
MAEALMSGVNGKATMRIDVHVLRQHSIALLRKERNRLPDSKHAMHFTSMDHRLGVCLSNTKMAVFGGGKTPEVADRRSWSIL